MTSSMSCSPTWADRKRTSGIRPERRSQRPAVLSGCVAEGARSSAVLRVPRRLRARSPCRAWEVIGMLGLTLESSPRLSVQRMGETGLRERRLRVGELAEAVGASGDTIRYYERAGLLPAPERTTTGYRAYDQSAV